MHDITIDSISIEELLPILNGISDAVFIDDGDGRFIWCNTACEELYRISCSETCGRYIEELEETGIFSPSVARRVIAEKREITMIHENRYGLKLLTTGRPLMDSSGNVSKVITTSRDITHLTDLQSRLNSADQPEDSDISVYFESSDIIAASHAMQNVMTLTKRLASVDSTVLITGESGAGKGVIARFLHDEGSRSSGPFITVNCGAIPENLIESELFGYVAGAFTGSRAGGKSGLFEAAQHGTIFLDEISELPLNLQVKLLRVIQEREITPVGSVSSVSIDVRVISATNRDLLKLVRENKFREDLYYRLNVVPVNVPPLRSRLDDILPLIQMSLSKYNKKLNENKTISPEALAVLLKYPWPGNIRELQNIIERLIIISGSSRINENDLPAFIHQAADNNTDTAGSLADAMEKAEKEILADALATYGSTRAMARMLKVSQPTIVRKLHKYGLSKNSL